MIQCQERTNSLLYAQKIKKKQKKPKVKVATSDNNNMRWEKRVADIQTPVNNTDF